MKTTLLSLSLLLTVFVKSQNVNAIVNIWRVTPTVVCQGDWVKVSFKYVPPSPFTYTVNTTKFYVNPPLAMIAEDNSVNFPNYPTEWFAPLGPNDYCYYFWAQLPSNLSLGTHSIITNGTHGNNVIQVTICTGIEENQNESTEQVIYFDLLGNRIEPRKNELIIKQVGNKRSKVIIN